MRLGRLRISSSLVLSIFVFLFVVILVGMLQNIMLAPHLEYGFADVDWVFLYRFNNLDPFSLNQVINEWQASGVYAYQTYYIGLQELMYGLNYYYFHLTTNIFRYLSVITLFPVVLYFSRSKLLAFLTTLLYGVSYTAIGAMYTVVTSGIYLAITLINLFLVLYIYSIKNNDTRWWVIVGLFILFFSAMFWSTERLYPLFPLLIMIEGFLIWRGGFKKSVVVPASKRLLLVAVPLLLGLLYRPYAATNVQFIGNTGLLLDKISDGNWQFLLVPFISLGGLFVPRDYWKYFGTVNDSDFAKYLDFYIVDFGITFLIITFILAFVSARKPLIFILRTLIPTLIMGLITFFLINHRLSIPENLRVHFDPIIYLIPGLIGQYVISLSFAFFEEWREGGYKQILQFCAFFGPFMALLFIISTWLAAEPGLMFTSVHRYLTVAGIGSSLFLASVILLIYFKLRSIKFIKHLAVLIFILIVPYIILNDKVTQSYFKYELDFAGTRGSEHDRIKNKFTSFLGSDYKNNEPSLFFVDGSGDYDNGYFHETVILAGFDYWMMFKAGADPGKGIKPTLIRNDFFCPEKNCAEKFKKLVIEKDGVKGILYNNTFYPYNRVYAYKLNRRDAYFIQEEFFRQIGFEN